MSNDRRQIEALIAVTPHYAHEGPIGPAKLERAINEISRSLGTSFSSLAFTLVVPPEMEREAVRVTTATIMDPGGPNPFAGLVSPLVLYALEGSPLWYVLAKGHTS